MRALIISDIHANLVAFETVLEHAGEVDAVWCLGDVVGYGPNPNECIALLKEQPNMVSIMGNHDAAAIDELELNTFNPEARRSIEWMREILEPECFEFLGSRPRQLVMEGVTLVHGSPRQPIYEYLLDTRAATENFEYFTTDFCFIGHTHLPVLFYMEPGDYLAGLTIPPIQQKTKLKPRAIINPGSVGQPRDRDPRAAYALYDSEEITWHYRRVEYEITATQERMQKADLPERHILRLEGGW